MFDLFVTSLSLFLCFSSPPPLGTKYNLTSIFFTSFFVFMCCFFFFFLFLLIISFLSCVDSVLVFLFSFLFFSGSGSGC